MVQVQMSDENEMSLAGLAVKLFGIVVLVLGLFLTYFSIKADVELVNPRLFIPIGLAVAIVGGSMLLAKEA